MDIERLEEIKNEIKELVEQAADIISENRQASERARAYWLAHIRIALDDDHEYLGSSGCTMQDTINELKGGEEEDEG